MKRVIQAAIGIAVAVAAVVWFAGGYHDSVFRDPSPVAINTGDSDIAIQGYDPVAYFREGRAVEGDAAHSVHVGGAEFRFASAENRALFAGNTEKYLPAYGGYCAYGVTQKQKFDIDPNAWEIVDGRLYFQLDPGTRLIWLENRDAHIATADRFWPEIKPHSPADL